MIENITELNLTQLFIDFDIETKPIWGKMSLQHAVEHLSNTIKTSNGKIVLKKPDVPDHMFDQLRKFLVGKNEFPMGFISPLVGEDLPNLRFEKIEKAIEELQNEIKTYAEFWNQNPSATFFNPTFGTLNHEQWQKFHAKHFTHHFKQFGIKIS